MRMAMVVKVAEAKEAVVAEAKQDEEAMDLDEEAEVTTEVQTEPVLSTSTLRGGITCPGKNDRKFLKLEKRRGITPRPTPRTIPKVPTKPKLKPN